jgi:fatty-acid desaturase
MATGTIKPSPEEKRGRKKKARARRQDHVPQTKLQGRARKQERDLAVAEGRTGSTGPEPRRKMHPREWYPKGVCWSIALWLIAIHVGALAAPWFFTWEGLILALGLHWLTGGIGVCLGFHRLFTHRSFATYAPIRWVIALIGGLSGEGSVIDWVANHRKHHALSDKEGDPHSPLDGAWWSHAFWLARTRTLEERDAHWAKWAPDLLKDRSLRFLDATFLVWQFAFAGLLYGAGYWLGGTFMACSFLVWGMFVRLTMVLHSTWFVNSASHMWGYKNYDTTDDSRNNWWVALITYGEGWHNNHHAYPRMAQHGHRWWEVDVTYMTILLLKRLGLAWDIVDYKKRSAVG